MCRRCVKIASISIRLGSNFCMSLTRFFSNYLLVFFVRSMLMWIWCGSHISASVVLCRCFNWVQCDAFNQRFNLFIWSASGIQQYLFSYSSEPCSSIHMPYILQKFNLFMLCYCKQCAVVSIILNLLNVCESLVKIK